MGLISRVSSRTYRKKNNKNQLFIKINNHVRYKPRIQCPKMQCQWKIDWCQRPRQASIQLNVSEVDENGRMTGSNVTYAICGNLRKMGESDDAINRLAKSHGIIKAGVF